MPLLCYGCMLVQGLDGRTVLGRVWGTARYDMVFGGEGICSQSGFALPTTTIGIASVRFHLLLAFCLCIFSAWGTVWDSLTNVFASAHVS